MQVAGTQRAAGTDDAAATAAGGQEERSPASSPADQRDSITTSHHRQPAITHRYVSSRSHHSLRVYRVLFTGARVCLSVCLSVRSCSIVHCIGVAVYS